MEKDATCCILLKLKNGMTILGILEIISMLVVAYNLIMIPFEIMDLNKPRDYYYDR